MSRIENIIFAPEGHRNSLYRTGVMAQYTECLVNRYSELLLYRHQLVKRGLHSVEEHVVK